jgi:hypothetical protein
MILQAAITAHGSRPVSVANRLGKDKQVKTPFAGTANNKNKKNYIKEDIKKK